MKNKRDSKKWWFWTIIIIIILFIIFLFIPYIILKNICWSSLIEGYKNIETGKCENLTGCLRHQVSEGYVFDEKCWTNSTSAQAWEQKELGFCEDCDKCPRGSFCFPMCEIHCS